MFYLSNSLSTLLRFGSISRFKNKVNQCNKSKSLFGRFQIWKLELQLENYKVGKTKKKQKKQTFERSLEPTKREIQSGWHTRRSNLALENYPEKQTHFCRKLPPIAPFKGTWTEQTVCLERKPTWRKTRCCDFYPFFKIYDNRISAGHSSTKENVVTP